jgi:transcriptional regulator with XRE-family HTH domain
MQRERSVGCMARVSGKSTSSSLLASLGERVRGRRKELGLSQEALADLAGIDRSHMGKIERGERNVTVLNVERIATALQVDVWDLMKPL